MFGPLGTRAESKERVKLIAPGARWP